MIESDRIVTTLNTKDLDGEYVRYNIGASSKNISYDFNNKKYPVENVLNKIRIGCLNSNDLSFALQHPLTIIQSTGAKNIYNGTIDRSIDLSKFLTKSSKWNNMGVDLSVKQYKVHSWDSQNVIKEISYDSQKGWITTDRKKQSGIKAYWYPLYSGSMSYRPTSICKITLPKGTYLINYGVQVANKYDSNFSNSNFTGNVGIQENAKIYFAEDGIVKVEPGLVTATLCSDEDFKEIQKYTYKEYPSDMNSILQNYYSPIISRTAPRVTGTVFNSAYTGHSMIFSASKQEVMHLVVTHQNVPTDKMKKGYFVDSNKTKRILCPIGGWIQILALTDIS